jgi:hypothetical protein
MSYDFTDVLIQVYVNNKTYIRSYLRYLGYLMCVIIPSWCHKHRKSLGLVYINTGPCHVIWFYCCPYTGIRIQFNVSPTLIGIPRQFGVHYNPVLVPYTPHVTRFSVYKDRTLSCHVILLLFIYRYKNWTLRISFCNWHTSTIPCALYSIDSTVYSARQSV